MLWNRVTPPPVLLIVTPILKNAEKAFHDIDCQYISSKWSPLISIDSGALEAAWRFLTTLPVVDNHERLFIIHQWFTTISDNISDAHYLSYERLRFACVGGE